MLINRRIIVSLILTLLIGKNFGTGSGRRAKKVDSLLGEEERKEIGKAKSLIAEKDKESPPAGSPQNEESQGNAQTQFAPSLLSTMGQQQQSHGPQLAPSLLQKEEKAPSLVPQKKQSARKSLLQQEQEGQLASSLLQQEQLAPSLLPQKRQLAPSLLQKEHVKQEQLAPSLLPQEQQDQSEPSLLQKRQLAPSLLQGEQLASSLLPKKGQLTPSLLQQEHKEQLAPSLLQKRQLAPSLLQQEQLAPSLLQKGEKAPSLLSYRKKASSLLQHGKLAPSLLSSTEPAADSDVNLNILNEGRRAGTWLDSSIIDAYLERIVSSGRPGLEFVPNFIIDMYVGNKKEHAEEIGNWIMKIDWPAIQLLFVPVFLAPNHWAMGVYRPSDQEFTMFDSNTSLGRVNEKNEFMGKMTEFFTDIGQIHGQTFDQDVHLVEGTNTPQQDNDSDCGVFALMFAYYIGKERRILDNFNHCNMNANAFREKIYQDIYAIKFGQQTSASAAATSTSGDFLLASAESASTASGKRIEPGSAPTTTTNIRKKSNTPSKVMLNFGTQQVEQIYDAQAQRQIRGRRLSRLRHHQNIPEHIPAAEEASQKGEQQQQVTTLPVGSLANPVVGASSSRVITPTFHQQQADEIEQKYEIAIGVKRYDGGDVKLLKKNENKPIEDVLSQYYGMKNVEYIPYGQLKYNGQVHKIVDFINTIVAKGDNKWMMPKQEQQGSHLFRPIFDGHIMVALFDTNRIEKVRFHFNHYGLNVYRKSNGNNYVIEEEKQPEDDTNRVSDEARRGWYQRQFFEKPLFTRTITVMELKRIALNEVIQNRKWSVDKGFSCRHFAYEFVLSIVEKPTAEALMRDFYKWPKPLVDYDQFITRYYDIDVKAYDKSVQDYYYRTSASRT